MMGRQVFEYVNTRHRNSTFCEVYIKIKQICSYNFFFAKSRIKKARIKCQELLILSWRRPLSYRNLSTDLLRKSMDWFLYDNGLRHEKVKVSNVAWIQKVTNLHFMIWIYNLLNL